MSERIENTGTGATAYEMDELKDSYEFMGGSVTHSEEELENYRSSIEPDNDKDDPQKESDPVKPEKEPGVKPTRRDKGKSRQRAEDYRKKQEQEKNKTELSAQEKHEKWAFERAREIDLFSDEHEVLASARERLAEASVKMRHGKLPFVSAKDRRQFEAAVEAYKEERDKFIEQQLEESGAPLYRKRALTAALSAREDGALMGEEANYYLQQEKLRQQSKWEQAKAWYKERGRVSKIMIGVGTTAVMGTLGGFVAGGAVVGAYAGRAARMYLGREANRNDPFKEKTEQEKESTLRSSSMKDYQSTYQSLRSLRRGSRKIETEDLVSTSQNELDSFLHGITSNGAEQGQDNQGYVETAKSEARDKQRSLALALGGAVLGASAGALVESAGGFDGVLRDGEGGGTGSGEAGPDVSDDTDPETQQRIDELEEDIGEAQEESQALDEEIEEERQEQQDLQEQLDDTEESSEVSEQAQHLYGELAGETLDIDIPEGSNVWDQLEATVDENMPNADYNEKQRLVGNMLNAMEEQYPGRDLNLVYPGETFSVTLPS